MTKDDSHTASEVSFASLIVTLSSSAWMGLGKIADPISGEIKKDMAGVRYSIEILIMLRDKTKGNLSKDEERLLSSVIADLQANYAEAVFEEGNKAASGETRGSQPANGAAEGGAGLGESAPSGGGKE